MITFTRGKLSKMSGVHIETIRFYENEGVLPEPKRAHNGYRLYDKKYVL
ncbi:MAG: MerR family DNA-binding transcriptional regulator, partial [Bacillus sp. (in: Bacteria)]|nr:MerR family DNA-binding transcriptional regulator [Bacillus sp. (in: firmicutes)]